MTMMLERCACRSGPVPRSPDRPALTPVRTRPKKPLDSELARVLKARSRPADELPRCGVAAEEMGDEAVDEVRNASELTEDTEPEPLRQAAAEFPHAGAATIVCDGKGGYRVSLGSWAGAPCGTESCVRKHEESHIADWKTRWPKGCEGKDDGDDIPTGGDGYRAFLKTSECTAHTVDLTCAENLAKSAKGDCKAKVEKYRKLTAGQKAKYC